MVQLIKFFGSEKPIHKSAGKVLVLQFDGLSRTLDVQKVSHLVEGLLEEGSSALRGV